MAMCSCEAPAICLSNSSRHSVGFVASISRNNPDTEVDDSIIDLGVSAAIISSSNVFPQPGTGEVT